MVKPLLWIMCLSSVSMFGQKYELPTLNEAGRFTKDFASKDWIVTDSLEGDLNNDQLSDKVFVIAKIDSAIIKDDRGEEYNVRPRVLIIAINENNRKLRLADYNATILIDYNSPPTHGFPFNSMTIENGILTLQFSFDYVNGNFYFYTYNFQFDKNGFKLIGANLNYVTRATMNFKSTNYNFVTRKYTNTAGTYSTDDPPRLDEKTVPFNLQFDGLKAFKEMGRPGTWQLAEGSWL